MPRAAAPVCGAGRGTVKLIRVEIRRLRVLGEVELEPSPAVNLIVGPNASGKTSLLEGLHLLALGRSFRTHRSAELIASGASSLEVRGVVQGRYGALGIEVRRDRHNTRIWVNGKPVGSASELARRLPLAALTPHTDGLLEGGPRERRRLLDWALFHVEQGYHETWKAYHRTLRQRNTLLRGHASPAVLTAWECELARHAERLDRSRAIWIEALTPVFSALAEGLVGVRLGFAYRRGWPAGTPLDALLAAQRADDARAGFTRSGPHRADVVLETPDGPASRTLSRGQGKMAVAVLVVAHTRLLAERSGVRPLLLVDDFGAELDAVHVTALGRLLDTAGGQLFLTATAEARLPDWPGRSVRLFHVEQGRIRKVV